MRQARLIMVVLVVLGLQVGFWPALRPFDVVPNMALALVVLTGLSGTATVALSVALVAGLLLDLTSGADFGLRLGLLVLAALATGVVHRAGLNMGGPAVALGLVLAGTLVQDAAVLAGVAGVAVSWSWGVIVAKMGIEIILNLGLTLVLRQVMRWAMPPEPGATIAGLSE